MGLKKSFSELKKASLDQLKEAFTCLPLFKDIKVKTNLTKKDHDAVLTAITYAFTKASLIDRDFSHEEQKEVCKRLSRFIRLDEEVLTTLILQAQRDLKSSQGRSADFIASFYCFLGKKADEKSRHRIYRYLASVVASDDEVADEERYLMELVGEAFGLGQKEVREYLLTSEFLTHQDDISPSQREDIPSSQEMPVIKFNLE